MLENKKLTEEELKIVNGGANIVNKESEEKDCERDFNRLNNICQRRSKDITNSFNLMQQIVDDSSDIQQK